LTNPWLSLKGSTTVFPRKKGRWLKFRTLIIHQLEIRKH